MAVRGLAEALAIMALAVAAGIIYAGATKPPNIGLGKVMLTAYTLIAALAGWALAGVGAWIGKSKFSRIGAGVAGLGIIIGLALVSR